MRVLRRVAWRTPRRLLTPIGECPACATLSPKKDEDAGTSGKRQTIGEIVSAAKFAKLSQSPKKCVGLGSLKKHNKPDSSKEGNLVGHPPAYWESYL